MKLFFESVLFRIVRITLRPDNFFRGSFGKLKLVIAVEAFAVAESGCKSCHSSRGCPWSARSTGHCGLRNNVAHGTGHGKSLPECPSTGLAIRVFYRPHKVWKVIASRWPQGLWTSEHFFVASSTSRFELKLFSRICFVFLKKIFKVFSFFRELFDEHVWTRYDF